MVQVRAWSLKEIILGRRKKGSEGARELPLPQPDYPSSASLKRPPWSEGQVAPWPEEGSPAEVT